jgi:hypothetical protein
LTIVVLLVLAVIWAAVLVPPFVRARSESRPADSIGNFRRQLYVLERTGPVVVPAANSLRLGGVRPVPAFRSPNRMQSPDALRRARTLKRRRDVLFTLVGVMGATLLLGAVPGLRVLWVLHVLCDALFAGYVVLLVRMRNMAAERDMKLRFIPTVAAEPSLLLQRSAN